MTKPSGRKGIAGSPVKFPALGLALLCLCLAIVGPAEAQVSGNGYVPSINTVSCTSSSTPTCTAYDSTTGACTSWTDVCNNDEKCEDTGTADTVAAALQANFLQNMNNTATALENFLYDRVVEFLESEYKQVENIEFSMIEWWKTMWYYNLLPGLQGMTRELNIGLAAQAFSLQTQADATGIVEKNLALQVHALEDQGIRPGEQICVAGTMAGGLTRATVFSRAMRAAWENESIARGLNTKGVINETAGVNSAADRYQAFINNFCDDYANSSDPFKGLIRNNCNPDNLKLHPEFLNADVEPVRHLFNQLTIDVDAANGDGERSELMVESLIANMVGVPESSPIQKDASASTHGQDVYLGRRSFLARHEALRSIPYMIAGWRMPGSQMGDWVKSLRTNAGIPLTQISGNPSYKEIMHALSVDRFNTGTYAANMMTDPIKVDMEKLDLSVFYLMQLRDYYDLLERTALTLAVQVSVIANETSKGAVGTQAAVPIR